MDQANFYSNFEMGAQFDQSYVKILHQGYNNLENIEYGFETGQNEYGSALEQNFDNTSNIEQTHL